MDEIDQFLASVSPAVQEISLAVRKLVKETVPEAAEKIYPGWHNVGYSLGSGMKNQFCAVAPQRGYVNLYFMQGADLPDPHGLLEGAGKKMRHIKARKLEDLQPTGVRELILAASSFCQP